MNRRMHLGLMMAVLWATVAVAQDGILVWTKDARGSALGGATAPAKGTMSGFRQNPAVLGYVKGIEVSSSYLQMLLDMAYGDLSVGVPVGRWAFGASFGLISYGKLDDVQNYVTIQQNLTAAEYLFGGHAAYRPLETMPGLSVGVGVKYAVVSLFGSSGGLFAADVGGSYAFSLPSLTKGIDGEPVVGLSVLNLGSGRVGGGSLSAPMAIRLGGSYKPLKQLRVALDGEIGLTTDSSVHVGLEGMPDWYVSPRLGFQAGKAGRTGLTLGFGGQYATAGFGGAFDYAFLLNESSGIRHMVTLTMKFR